MQSQANTAYSSVSGVSQSSAIPGQYNLLQRIGCGSKSHQPRLTIHGKGEKAIKRLVEKRADVFSWSDDQVGCTGLLKHWIMLRTDTPVAEPYRRIPPSQLKEVLSHLDIVLAQDIITPSTSPYAVPIVLVHKKNQASFGCAATTGNSIIYNEERCLPHPTNGRLHRRPPWV